MFDPLVDSTSLSVESGKCGLIEEDPIFAEKAMEEMQWSELV